MDKSSPDYIFSAGAAIAEVYPNGMYYDVPRYGDFCYEKMVEGHSLCDDDHTILRDRNGQRHAQFFFKTKAEIKNFGYRSIATCTDIEGVVAKLADVEPKNATLHQWLKQRKRNKATKRCVLLLQYYTNQKSFVEWLVVDGHQIAEYRDRTPTFLINNNFRNFRVVDAMEKIS